MTAIFRPDETSAVIDGRGQIFVLQEPNVAAVLSGGGGGGTVTSVNVSGGDTGLTVTGGPITDSGTLTLGGFLNLANLEQGANGAFVVGRATNTGAVSRIVMSASATANTVVVRGTGGVVTVGTPTATDHAVTLGHLQTGTVTMSGKTLAAPVINGYTEGDATASGTTFSPSLAQDTLFHYTTTGNATVTMPTAVRGKSFVVVIQYGGAHSLTWAGAAIRWSGGVAPTPTSVSGKRDTFPFFCVDGTSWQNGGMNA